MAVAQQEHEWRENAQQGILRITNLARGQQGREQAAARNMEHQFRNGLDEVATVINGMATNAREVDVGRAQQYHAWAARSESRMDDSQARVYIALEFETEAIARAQRTNDELAEQLRCA